MNSTQQLAYQTLYFELIATLFALYTGSELLRQVTSGCVGFRFLGITLVLIGVAFLVQFATTCACARGPSASSMIMIKNACCSMPLILTCVALGVFSLAVSSQGGGTSGPRRSYVGSYSKWMQHKVNDAHAWDKYYKKAVVTNKVFVCAQENSAFQYGCCEPPKDCNFNDTSHDEVWVKVENNTNPNIDCKRWDNDPNTLCFNCESCKAGFLQDVTSHWFTTSLFLVVLGTVLTLMLAVSAINFSFSSESSTQDYMALA